MSPTDIRALIDRYIDAYNCKDIDSMLIGVHPQVEFKNISAGMVNASTNGIAELRTRCDKFSPQYLDLAYGIAF